MTPSRYGVLVAAVVVTDLLAALAGRDEPVAQIAAVAVTWLVVPGCWTAAALLRPDLRHLAVAAGGALALAAILSGGLNAGVLASLTLAGVAGSMAMQHRWRVLPVLSVTALFLIPSAVLPMAGTSFSEATAEQWRMLREQYETQMPQDMSPGDREASLAAFDVIGDRSRRMTERFWPSLVLAGLVSQAALFLVAGWGLARMVAPRTVGKRGRLPSLATWRAPFATVWVLIGGLALSLIGSGAAATIGWNLVVVAATLLFCQGLGLQIWLVRRVMPPIGQVLFWVLGALFFAPAVIGGGALIGLADQWMDLRRLRRPPENDDET